MNYDHDYAQAKENKENESFDAFWKEYGFTTTTEILAESYKEVARKAWNEAIRSSARKCYDMRVKWKAAGFNYHELSCASSQVIENEINYLRK